MQKITVKWFSDDGHAWLAVRANDMAACGLREKDMSVYSYKDANNPAPSLYYLEEDCDAGFFIQAAEKLGYELEYLEAVNTDGSSWIRRMPRMKGESLLFNKAMQEKEAAKATA